MTNETASNSQPSNPWIVRTTTGLVKGHAENGVTAFRGIPYAEKPIGDRRFRRAEPIAPWEGVFNAATSGDACSQYRPARKSAGNWEGTEDCLWLNVVVPRPAHSPGTDAPAIDPEANRPVVVYFHGGSNIHGSANKPLLSGEYFTQAIDCVYVAVNYRVGIFGQLALGEGTHTPDDMDTNAGHSDLLTALRWIHDNARVFGGDPDRVTIMGESSGGSMVTSLLATPSAKGLFSAAIAQSPAPMIAHTRANAKYWTDFAARWLQRMRAEESLPLDQRAPVRQAPPELSDEELQAATADLLTAEHAILGRLSDEMVRFHADNPISKAGPFAPVIDGDLLPQHPLTPGAMMDVPLLIGSNRNEYDMMHLEPKSSSIQYERSRTFAHAISGSAAHATDILERHYGGPKSRKLKGRFFGDALFTGPSWYLAQHHPSHRAWVYRLDTTTPFLRYTGMGAVHALDLPILFQRYDQDKGRIAILLGGRDEMRATSVAMQSRWRQFVHSHDPGFDPYSLGFATQVFDAHFPTGEQTIYDPQPELREAWAQVQWDKQEETLD